MINLFHRPVQTFQGNDGQQSCWECLRMCWVMESFPSPAPEPWTEPSEGNAGLSFGHGTWHAGNVWLFSRHKICVYVATEELIVAVGNLTWYTFPSLFTFSSLLYLSSDLQLKDTNYSNGTERKYGRVCVTVFSFCNVPLGVTLQKWSWKSDLSHRVETQ